MHSIWLILWFQERSHQAASSGAVPNDHDTERSSFCSAFVSADETTLGKSLTNVCRSLPFMAAGSQLSVIVPGNSASSYCCIARKCLNAPQKHLLRMLNIGGQQLELLFKTGWHSDGEDCCKNGILAVSPNVQVLAFRWHKQEKLWVLSWRRVWGSNALPQTTSPWSWQTAQGEA